jgi:hypothetical protein
MRNLEMLLLASLIVLAFVVIPERQQVKGYSTENLTDTIAAKIIKGIKDALSNKILPLFVQKCKTELGIPQDQVLHLTSDLKCHNAIVELKSGDIAREVYAQTNLNQTRK